MKTAKTDIIVIAAAKAKPGREADLERALREAAIPTRQQPGCVQFSLYRSNDTIVGFERWTSEADHQHHLQGAHIQTLMAKFSDILAEPPNITSCEIVED